MLEAKLFWFALAGALVVGVIAFAALRRGDVGKADFSPINPITFRPSGCSTTCHRTGQTPPRSSRPSSTSAQAMRRAGFGLGQTPAIGSRASRQQPLIGLPRAARCCARTTTIARRNFFSPDDARRPMSTAKNIQSFYAGLDMLAVAYQQIKVPYGEGHHLEAVYYPAATGGPSRLLIVLGGGYDSTLEELYFVLVKDAHEHGYAVL